MATYTIPVSQRAQRFKIALGGVTYQLTLSWCTQGAVWLVDFADAAGNPILTGVPLVLGADLLGQYPDLGFGGELIVYNGPGVMASPSYDDLGVAGSLYFVTP